MRFKSKSIETRCMHEAMFAETFRSVNERRVQQGKSPIWVSEGYNIHDRFEVMLSKKTGTQQSRDGLSAATPEQFCEMVNTMFRPYTGGAPVISSGSYAKMASDFTKMTSGDEQDGVKTRMCPMSPFDRMFRDKRVFREAGSRTLYMKEYDLRDFSDSLDPAVVTTWGFKGTLLREKGGKDAFEYAGRAYSPDDKYGLARFSAYLSRPDYNTLSSAIAEADRKAGYNSPILSEESIQQSLNVMKILEDRGELQSMSVSRGGKGMRPGEVHLVNPAGVGICIAKPGDESYTGRIYNSKQGLSAYFSSTATTRENGSYRRSRPVGIGAKDIVAAYDYVCGRSVDSPLTGKPIGEPVLGADGQMCAANVEKKFTMRYNKFEGQSSKLDFNTLVLDYNARSAGMPQTRSPEVADEEVEATVKGSIANFRRRVGVDRLISNALVHAASGCEYVPRYDSDDTIKDIQVDCMAVLQGTKKTLLKPGFSKSDFTGNISDGDSLETSGLASDEDPVYHGTPEEIVQQYVSDMTKHLIGSYELDDETGVRFDPANVVNYAPNLADSIRGRDDFAEMLRQSTLDPQELKCDSMSAKTLKDKLVKFDTESAHPMYQDDNASIKKYGEIIERTLAETGCVVKPDDIQIDKHGLVQYSAFVASRMKPKANQDENYKPHQVTMGPVFRQGEDGVVESTYFGQGDTAFIPRSRGTIMPVKKDGTIDALDRIWRGANGRTKRGEEVGTDFPTLDQVAWTADQYLKGNLSAPREMCEHFIGTSSDDTCKRALTQFCNEMKAHQNPTQQQRADSRKVEQGFDIGRASSELTETASQRSVYMELCERGVDSGSHPFERIKVDDFETVMGEKLAATVRLYAVSGFSSVEDPMVLDSVCKEFRDKRLSEDYEAMLSQGGMSKEGVEAQKKAWADVVMLDATYSDIATTANMNLMSANIDSVNDNFSGVLKLTNNKPVDLTPPGAMIPFDHNSWTLPTGRVNLVKKAGSRVDEDGILVASGDENDMSESAKYVFRLDDGTSATSSVAANRTDMATKDSRNSTGRIHANVSFGNFGGWTFEDGSAISEKFANRLLVYNKHGDDAADDIVRLWRTTGCDFTNGTTSFDDMPEDIAKRLSGGNQSTDTYTAGQIAAASKAYLSGDTDVLEKLQRGELQPVDDESEYEDLYAAVAKKSHTRPARVGDKCSLNGYKETIGKVVPTDEDSKLGELFRENNLDIVLGAQSMPGRAVGFVYMSGRQHTDTLHVNGKDIPNGIATCEFAITPYTADSKTHADGRNISVQQALIMQSAGAKHIVSELYGTNERAAAKVRERLIMLGKDMGPDMTLYDSYHGHPGETREIIDPIKPQAKVTTSAKTGKESVRFDLTAVKNDIAQNVMARESGSFLKIRTPLTYPATKDMPGRQLDLAPKSDPNEPDSYLFPIPAKCIRSGSKENPSSLGRHLETIAVSDAKLAYLLEQGEDPKSDKCEKERNNMQSAFNSITDYIIENHLKTKHNMFRDELLRNNVDGATAILTGDPSIPLNEIAIGPDMAKKLGITSGEKVLMWRDPVIEDNGMVYTKCTVRDDVTGVAMNPVQAERFRGDFDGDSVAIVNLKEEESKREAEEIYSWEANELRRSSEDAKTGNKESTYEMELDIKAAFRDNPVLKETYDGIVQNMNDAEKSLSGDDLKAARDGNMQAMNDLVKECFDASFGTDVLQFGDAAEHMMSMGKITGVGMIRKGDDGQFEVMQEAGPSVKGDVAKQMNYAKYAGISFKAYALEDDGSYRELADGEKKKSGVYIDYDSVVDHGHSIASIDDQIQVQQATNIGKDVGRGGKLRQDIVKAIGLDPVYEVEVKDGDVEHAVVKAGKPTGRLMTSVVSDIVSSYEQVLLDSKHDAPQAMYNHKFVGNVLPALWSGKKFNMPPEQSAYGPVYSVALNDDGTEKRATMDEFRKQFMEIHESVGINITSEMMANVANSMAIHVDGSSKEIAMDVCDKDIIRKQSSPILALAYQNDAMAYDILSKYAEAGAAVYGTGLDETGRQASKSSDMVCFASKKVRDNIEESVLAEAEGRTPNLTGFSQDTDMKPRNAVGKGDASEYGQYLCEQRNAMLAAIDCLDGYRDGADANIETLSRMWKHRLLLDKQDTGDHPVEPYANHIELTEATQAYFCGNDRAVVYMLRNVEERAGVSVDEQLESAGVSDRKDELGSRHDYAPEMRERLSEMCEASAGRDQQLELLQAMWKQPPKDTEFRQELTTVSQNYMLCVNEGTGNRGRLGIDVQDMADKYVDMIDKSYDKLSGATRSYVDAKLSGDEKAMQDIVDDHVRKKLGEDKLFSQEATELRQSFTEKSAKIADVVQVSRDLNRLMRGDLDEQPVPVQAAVVQEPEHVSDKSAVQQKDSQLDDDFSSVRRRIHDAYEKSPDGTLAMLDTMMRMPPANDSFKDRLVDAGRVCLSGDADEETLSSVRKGVVQMADDYVSCVNIVYNKLSPAMKSYVEHKMSGNDTAAEDAVSVGLAHKGISAESDEASQFVEKFKRNGDKNVEVISARDFVASVRSGDTPWLESEDDVSDDFAFVAESDGSRPVGSKLESVVQDDNALAGSGKSKRQCE